MIDTEHLMPEPPSPTPAMYDARATRVEDALRVVDEANTALRDDVAAKRHPFVTAAATGADLVGVDPHR